MTLQSFHRWIVLRLTFGPRTLCVGYEDDQGVRRIPPIQGNTDAAGWLQMPTLYVPNSPFAMPSIRTTLVPNDFVALLSAATEALPQTRIGPYGGHPIPLPVFVAPPQQSGAAGWEAWVQSLLDEVAPQNRAQVMRLGHNTWASRPMLQLPIRVLAVGERCFDALGGVRSASWYQFDLSTQRYGLNIERAEPEQLAAALKAQQRDIVVADETTVARILQFAQRCPWESDTRPRLVIVLDSTSRKFSPSYEYAAGLRLPRGMSMLWVHNDEVQNTDVSQILQTLFLGLVHDYPLHEALSTLPRSAPGLLPPPPAMLFSDPAANQDLRLADAFAQQLRDVSSVSQFVTPGQVTPFLNRLDDQLYSLIEPMLRAADSVNQPVDELLRRAQELQVDFQRESTGLAPLAEIEELLVAARKASASVMSMLQPLTNDPDLLRQFRASQKRRVDMTLDALDPNELIYRPVETFASLVANQRYRLNVLVGHRQRYSVMATEPPALDPLLPDPPNQSGYTLDVVVYEKDFILHSPRIQELYLPLVGGSHAVSFEIQAANELAQAELRIAIYHRNFLLQSFTLRAQVDPSFARVDRNTPQVQVILDYSASANYSNLDSLKPRTLSIAVNQDLNGHTHSLFIKKGKQAVSPVRFPEQLLSTHMKEFRELLVEATYKNPVKHEYSRFTSNIKPDTQPSADFAEFIHKMASLGRDLYRNVFSTAPKALQEQLTALRGSSDETIQIARINPNFVFPWPMLYDYPFPRTRHGSPPPRVCLGHAFTDSAPEESGGRGCPHNPNTNAICIYGFWGVRHRIEQLIARPDGATDVVNTVAPQVTSKSICVAIGTHNDDPGAKVLSTFRNHLPGAVMELSRDDDLLSLLWDEKRRPAVLVVLSHLETEIRTDEPPKPRILPYPPTHWRTSREIPLSKWLIADDITDESIEHGGWTQQPLPIVLLMACESGTTDIATLNDFIRSLSLAGAAAVIGTECDVFSAFAARFASEVTEALWSGLPLGQAIQAFNLKYISAGNPLIFSFTSIGSADLQLIVKGGG